MKRPRPLAPGRLRPRASAPIVLTGALLLVTGPAGCPNSPVPDNPLTAVLSEGGITNPDGDGNPDAPADTNPGQWQAQSLSALAPPETTTTLTLAAQAPDDRPLTFVIVRPPRHGSLSQIRPLDATRAEIDYTPDPGFSGTDQFQYLVQNGQRKSQPGTVSLVVLPRVCFQATPTQGPSGLTAELRAFTVSGQSLPDDAILTWQLDDQTEAGPVSTHSLISYTFRGGGIHTVRLALTLAGITVPVGCTGANRDGDTLRITVYPTISGQILDGAGQPVAGVLVAVSPGNAQMLTGPDGHYSLIVPYEWSGSVTAVHDAYDFEPATWRLARVTRDVPGLDFLGRPANSGGDNDDGGTHHPPDAGTNRPPVAEDFGVQLAEDSQVTITLRASDPDGDTLQYRILSLPAHGWLRDAGNNLLIALKDLPYTLSNNGNAVTYIPGPDYAGSDSFTFRATDGAAQSNTATCALTITPVNDPPVIAQGSMISLTVEQDSTASDPPNNFTLSASDPDASAGELVWSICTPPAHGTAEVVSGSPGNPGQPVLLRYVPDAGYSGSDSFTVCVRDAAGEQDSGTVSVDVVPPTPSNTYYVDTNNPNASDNNPGTEALPFKTIQRAANLVGPGDTVLVKGGIYTETVRIRANGTPSQPITFRAYNGQSVIVDAENIREWCFYIGDSTTPAGDYVIIDGFECRNTAHLSGASAGILVRNTVGTVIRNCTVYNHASFGIFLQGNCRNTILEYNEVYNTELGIKLRKIDDNTYPRDCVVRWNHVHHQVNTVNSEDADAIAATKTENTIIEYNLCHHNDDDAIDNAESSNTIIRYNICYRSDPFSSPMGDGNGIKLGVSGGGGHVVHHNVVILNRVVGLVAGVAAGETPPLVYHNLAWGNGGKGISVSTGTNTTVINNISFGNGANDLPFVGAPAGFFDYNFVGDGGFDPAISPHNLSGDPRVGDLSGLINDSDNDGTPDALEPLDIPGNFSSTQAAIQYAQQVIAQAFTPQPDSPLIDAGFDVGRNFFDLLGNAAVDDPVVGNPWSGSGTGLYDIGPIEYIRP